MAKRKATPKTPKTKVVNADVVQSVKTGLRRAWAFITLKIHIQAERPASKEWARWNLPVLQGSYYLVIEVRIIGTTILWGWIELY